MWRRLGLVHRTQRVDAHDISVVWEINSCGGASPPICTKFKNQFYEKSGI